MASRAASASRSGRAQADEPEQAADLGGEHDLHDPPLGLGHDRLEVLRLAEQLARQRVERLRAGRVDEEPADAQQGVVARGAGGPPRGRQLLGPLQDLLDDDPRVTGRVTEPLEVALRVGEPVGVVDAQPVDGAGPDAVDEQLDGSRRTPRGPRPAPR